MKALIAISRILDRPSRLVGRWLIWLVAILVALQFTNVVLRYVFHSSDIKLQESVIYTHATLFMVMAGYAFLTDDHVRVDILYDPAGPRRRALIDVLGILFGVVPLCAMLAWSGWPFVLAAWKIREGAMFFGGIPAAYLLKTMIVIFVFLLALQALAILLRSIAVLCGETVEPFDRSNGADA